jgi:glycerophosphoryl diester phosphodiesterase
MAIEILAHRGWWEKPEEKNTLQALTRAFDAGLGVETDVRDCDGMIAVSHDPPTACSLRFSDLLAAYIQTGQPGVLALNVKADGLQTMVGKLLRDGAVDRYFLFDMSIPDTLQWLKAGLRVFVRQSEYEPTPTLYDQAAGIWLDAFTRDWYTPELIATHLAKGKQVAIVSPELHGRDPAAVWSILKPLSTGTIWLCTDRVAEARRFFHG